MCAGMGVPYHLEHKRVICERIPEGLNGCRSVEDIGVSENKSVQRERIYKTLIKFVYIV
jgi:hypothetical protein